MTDTREKTNPPTAPNTGAALTLRGVRKVFDGGDVVAVEKLDLDIRAGEFLAILGPSGCGKSTLLRLIANLDRPSAGSIEVRAADPGPERPARGELKIAYVFQDAHLLPWRNVLRNVALPLELAHVDKAERLDRAQEALALVGLSDATRRYPAQLSGGMRMRVSLARALVTKPSLLLLDEPFAALDEITRQQLDDQLRALWLSHRMTVIFVTHSIGEAAFLADRAVVLTRRPARIVLDRALDLPQHREVSLRTEARFATQTHALFEALQRGGAY